MLFHHTTTPVPIFQYVTRSHESETNSTLNIASHSDIFHVYRLLSMTLSFSLSAVSCYLILFVLLFFANIYCDLLHIAECVET